LVEEGLVADLVAVEDSLVEEELVTEDDIAVDDNFELEEVVVVYADTTALSKTTFEETDRVVEGDPFRAAKITNMAAANVARIKAEVFRMPYVFGRLRTGAAWSCRT
jgi:predicted acyltransferase (DUF342 family)